MADPTYRTARKAHDCYMCASTIRPGHAYCDHGEISNGERVRECWYCAGLSGANPAIAYADDHDRRGRPA